MSMRWYDRQARGARRQADTLPTHFALTDPHRFPDILAQTDAIPENWGLIYRHFGAPDRFDMAHALAERARARGWLYLVARDPELCALAGADGVHWPEASSNDAARWRRNNRDRVMTMAAHSPRALRRAAELGADTAFLSPVFATPSRGAGKALGAWRAGAMARAADLPVLALGGVTTDDTRRLMAAGFSGIGMVSGVIA